MECGLWVNNCRGRERSRIGWRVKLDCGLGEELSMGCSEAQFIFLSEISPVGTRMSDLYLHALTSHLMEMDLKK